MVVDHATDGLYGQVWSTPEHAGSHLDAPAHFAPHGARADQIPTERLVVECVVLDVHDRCAEDPDFTLRARLGLWAHGLGPAGYLEADELRAEHSCFVGR
jgi:kynurenine formamidase